MGQGKNDFLTALGLCPICKMETKSILFNQRPSKEVLESRDTSIQYRYQSEPCEACAEFQKNGKRYVLALTGHEENALSYMLPNEEENLEGNFGVSFIDADEIEIKDGKLKSIPKRACFVSSLLLKSIAPEEMKADIEEFLQAIKEQHARTGYLGYPVILGHEDFEHFFTLFGSIYDVIAQEAEGLTRE